MQYEVGYKNWVNRGGYELISGLSSTHLICEVSPIERVEENVLKANPALHREFASLEASTDAVVGFAKRYGLLNPKYRGSGRSADGKRVSRKTDELELWYTEMTAMREAIGLFDLAYGKHGKISPLALAKRFEYLESGATTEGLQQLSEKVIKLDSMWLRERWQGASGWRNLTPISSGMSDQENFIGAARASFVDLINRGLRNRVGPELIYNHSEDRSLISTPLALVTTGGLIGALWLQFARAVDEGKFFSQCSVCRSWFEGRAEASGPKGVRRSRDYCSDACRQKAYRDRKRIEKES